MQVRFLLGPAGSGKTFRCLAEIRAALLAGASGPPGEGAPAPAEIPEAVEPLVLLAPKQATFQLERQLLADDTLAGYTRLQVLSFDRLAEFVLAKLQAAPPRLLSGEGRLMVLRALLRGHDAELKLLRGSARRPGFAQELGGQLAELQRHQFGPARLRALAEDGTLRRELRDKLHDLALLAEKYADWLRRHELQDANCLLEVATSRLQSARNARPAPFTIQQLWLDGFAEMTPQEHALLAAVVPCCRAATLAFCLETEPTPATSWLSIWSAIGKTVQRCRAQLTALPGCQVQTEILRPPPGGGRFREHSALEAVAAGWALPVAGGLDGPDWPAQVSVTACDNPEAEARFAAREVLRFVRRDAAHRFRDCAVLVRNLETHHQPLARLFRQYDIPFFLDRREQVAHHPLAELTRGALRVVAHDWRHDDWFAALKAGFTPLPEEDLDRLENLALEFGWRGQQWRAPLADAYAETLRQRILPPFELFFGRFERLRLEPTGAELAEAIRELWEGLDVASTLETWSQPAPGAGPGPAAVWHRTVLEQMTAWTENVARAFPHEALPVRDWLPVLDAGLAGLTVGVIPPALDEVLVGAIDRARNPELKLAVVLGVNESIFPAAPASPVILTYADREELDRQNVALGPTALDQISRERYLGYIACTRARHKLAITFSRQDAGGGALNPSPFIAHLQRLLPSLASGTFAGATDWREAEHPGELIGEMVRLNSPDGPGEDGAAAPRPLLATPALQPLADRLAWLREPEAAENLAPALAARLYGEVLKSSVSRLEEFAQCPFRFFIHSGLRAGERRKFELDARERGSFQHEILKQFHDELTAEHKRWRELAPREARERIGRIAAGLAPLYRAGLLQADDRSRFTARALAAALQDFVETLVTWMRGQYQFDPAKAETGFGLDDPGLPAWCLDLGHGRQLALCGRVDRIDLCAAGDRSLAVVMDYKSSVRKLDRVLIAHGVQLQLLAYLAAVRRWPAAFFGARQIVPAGVFYVNLRGQFESADTRTEALAAADEARRLAYRHSGRFDATWLDQLDHPRARDQFNYQLNQDGGLRANSAEALSCKEFTALLDQVEAQLRALGERIYSGAAAVDPYRKGGATPCGYCDYRAVCRLDEWTHVYRELRPPEPAEAT